MICPNCLRRNAENAKVCPYCGAEIKTLRNPEPVGVLYGPPVNVDRRPMVYGPPVNFDGGRISPHSVAYGPPPVFMGGGCRMAILLPLLIVCIGAVIFFIFWVL